MKPRIDTIAAYIKSQIINKVKPPPFFAISCDEFTNIVNCACVYVRYVSKDQIEEKILYLQSLTAGTKSDDVFDSINYLDWNKLIELCKEGARSGLTQKLRKNNPMPVNTDSVIHRQALASKHLLQNLRQTLDSAINVVNSRLFILLCEDLDFDHIVLLFHTEVRWLSEGNMLARFHELKDEVIRFLELKGKNDVLKMFSNEQFR
ncbi:hypothetical protein ILUMI_12831 [Ignelater luminosus]|uniref:Zinc finger BED domain-containing protein 5 n=1 Tax=Ignelater luminosus TaxID=2038154 RepID=A0A8K0CXU8_IGNLU|nr:hypothetical protein ILUMI_12831 [Ignelater luminosus]